MQSKYEHILIRYGELALKGRNRNDFTRKLMRNVKTALSEFKNLEYQRTRDRMFIILNGENEEAIIPILKQIFGIYSFSLAKKVESNIDDIVDGAYDIMKDKEDVTFKIVARRRDKNFPMISDQINRACAAKILKNTDLKVDVRQPDIKVQIEVEEKFTYIMGDVILGAGGYPTGIAGKTLLMLSGGIDSPVAGHLTQKRGGYLEAIHFASPPYTSDQALDKVKRLGQKLTINQKNLKLYTVPFTELQLAIFDHVPESYAITIMRRMMFRIAERVAQDNACLAVVSGESMGQVSSQTLESMNVINNVVSLNVLRPLVSFDKLEITNIAKEIDTYKISIEPFEDACTIFEPQNPITKPTLEKCEEIEASFDWEELLEKCVENIEVEFLNHYVPIDEEIF